MTKEHLGLALALKIPIIVIITKIDMAPENILKQTLEDIQKILKMKGTLSGEFFAGKLVKIANGLEKFVSATIERRNEPFLTDFFSQEFAKCLWLSKTTTI